MPRFRDSHKSDSCLHPLGGNLRSIGKAMKDETLAIHAGYTTEPTSHAVTTPIYQTVAYEFDDAQHGADLFDLAVPGNIYSRIMNPTCDVLEQRIAALEGGVGALAVSAVVRRFITPSLTSPMPGTTS